MPPGPGHPHHLVEHRLGRGHVLEDVGRVADVDGAGAHRQRRAAAADHAGHRGAGGGEVTDGRVEPDVRRAGAPGTRRRSSPARRRRRAPRAAGQVHIGAELAHRVDGQRRVEPVRVGLLVQERPEQPDRAARASPGVAPGSGPAAPEAGPRRAEPTGSRRHRPPGSRPTAEPSRRGRRRRRSGRAATAHTAASIAACTNVPYAHSCPCPSSRPTTATAVPPGAATSAMPGSAPGRSCRTIMAASSSTTAATPPSATTSAISGTTIHQPPRDRRRDDWPPAVAGPPAASAASPTSSTAAAPATSPSRYGRSGVKRERHRRRRRRPAPRYACCHPSTRTARSRRAARASPSTRR